MLHHSVQPRRANPPHSCAPSLDPTQIQCDPSKSPARSRPALPQFKSAPCFQHEACSLTRQHSRSTALHPLKRFRTLKASKQGPCISPAAFASPRWENSIGLQRAGPAHDEAASAVKPQVTENTVECAVAECKIEHANFATRRFARARCAEGANRPRGLHIRPWFR